MKVATSKGETCFTNLPFKICMFSIVLNAYQFSVVILACIILNTNYFTFKEVTRSSFHYVLHTHKDILYSLMVAMTQSWPVAIWNLAEMLSKQTTTKEQKKWQKVLLISLSAANCIPVADVCELLTSDCPCLIASCLNTFAAPGHVGLLWTKHGEEPFQLTIMPGVLKSLESSELNGP